MLAVSLVVISVNKNSLIWQMTYFGLDSVSHTQQWQVRLKSVLFSQNQQQPIVPMSQSYSVGFTAHMPLLMATSAFLLGRRCWTSVNFVPACRFSELLEIILMYYITDNLTHGWWNLMCILFVHWHALQHVLGCLVHTVNRCGLMFVTDVALCDCLFVGHSREPYRSLWTAQCRLHMDSGWPD